MKKILSYQIFSFCDKMFLRFLQLALQLYSIQSAFDMIWTQNIRCIYNILMFYCYFKVYWNISPFCQMFAVFHLKDFWTLSCQFFSNDQQHSSLYSVLEDRLFSFCCPCIIVMLLMIRKIRKGADMKFKAQISPSDCPCR